MNIYNGQEFQIFCHNYKIGRHNRKGHFVIIFEEFERLAKLIQIHDGREGGLVLGKSHAEDGIHLLQLYSKDSLRQVGEMEGFEFLSPPNLSELQLSRLEEINKNREENTEQLPNSIKVIDTRDE